MKGLKKIALIAAIAAAPFAAQAELKTLDDTTMGSLTGQAGVTIELETKVSIGEFKYTDQGSLSVKGITIGGGTVERAADNSVTGVSGKLDDVYVDIDVLADGDATIVLHSISGAPIDFAVGVQSAELLGSTDSTLLASNIGIEGNLAALSLTVDTTTDSLNAVVAFSITDLDMDVDFLAVGIRNLTVHGAGFSGGASAANMFAVANVTMSKDARLHGTGDALKVVVGTFAADVAIGDVLIGGTSIGSVAINNLVISDTTMRVYGHD